MARIELQNIGKSYGSVEVMRDINLVVEDGEFIVLVGPSGCGKSSLLRMIAGLEPITAGEFSVDGKRLNEVPPRDRDMAMVFQSYALYPHMDVARNMGFSLEIRKAPSEERLSKVAAAAKTLGLSALTGRLPKALSGGQRQRVAMGRAIVRDPSAFLFDEPLSNLDAALRVEMRLEIARLHQRLKATMIYVTHDQVEALTLADRIVVLNAGKIQQVGTPLDLYERPSNRFVAQFIGSPTMNMLEVERAEGGIRLKDGTVLNLELGARQQRACELGVRPEHLNVVAPEAAHLSGVAELVEHLGSDTNIHASVPGIGQMLVRQHGHFPLKAGEPVHIALDLEKAHLFGPDGYRLKR
ncbi:ABC transporter ATP-binding protein [Roseibium salinum]|uniref:Sn-glycerol-3-phosphate ABC transporter ATP-binding protein UgpC n=1 Tax=Roseibium salinum TaxID=1604349 RepID=A0ABT3R8I1_9HYPH|nr:sn-glycerol-3-phosphate ABC transporter ATP-binding protein UgpC [Roseibium sp. DSM 29163]MCX2725622.1 sn-glycerol-3-phosphate ABC transporter ATP-binding protein UgpC [Roseibium sp. DSM 29163]MDN3720616.1 sn-glycerol-3-phosphate ABC transporter ATP-binding protein UgpC [Roseibium salinum]